MNNTLWQFGPDWIHQPTFGSEASEEVPSECLDEARAKTAHSVLALKTLPPILDIHRFGNLMRLLRVTSTVKRAVQRFKGVAIKPKISANDLIEAETYWTRIAQSTIQEQDFTSCNSYSSASFHTVGHQRCS